MDSYTEVLKFTLTALIAVVGWFLGHYFSSIRDRKNKKREVVTKHLINAYTFFAHEVSQRESGRERWEKLEFFISEIQLFGSPYQVALVKRMIEQMTSGKNFDLDPLINSLRNDLRKELELESITDNVVWIRYKENL